MNLFPQQQAMTFVDVAQQYIFGQPMSGLKQHYQRYVQSNTQQLNLIAQLAEKLQTMGVAQGQVAVMDAITLLASAYCQQQNLVSVEQQPSISSNIQRLNAMMQPQDRNRGPYVGAQHPSTARSEQVLLQMPGVGSMGGVDNTVGIIGGGTGSGSNALSQGGYPNPTHHNIGVVGGALGEVPVAPPPPAPVAPTPQQVAVVPPVIRSSRLGIVTLMDYCKYLLRVETMDRNVHMIISGGRADRQLRPVRASVGAIVKALSISEASEQPKCRFDIPFERFQHVDDAIASVEELVNQSRIMDGNVVVAATIATALGAPWTMAPGLVPGMMDGSLNSIDNVVVSMAICSDMIASSGDANHGNGLYIHHLALTNAINKVLKYYGKSWEIDSVVEDWHNIKGWIEEENVIDQGQLATWVGNYLYGGNAISLNDLTGVVRQTLAAIKLTVSSSEMLLDMLMDDTIMIVSRVTHKSLFTTLAKISTQLSINHVILVLMDCEFSLHLAPDNDSWYISRM